MSAAKKNAASVAVQSSPAPWVVAGPRDEKGHLFVSDDAGRLVAKVHFRSPSNDGMHESEANARLIAAAPDLLVVAESIALRGHATGCASVTSIDRPGAKKAPCDCLLGTAAAAIAKARGGT